MGMGLAGGVCRGLFGSGNKRAFFGCGCRRCTGDDPGGITTRGQILQHLRTQGFWFQATLYSICGIDLYPEPGSLRADLGHFSGFGADAIGIRCGSDGHNRVGLLR